MGLIIMEIGVFTAFFVQWALSDLWAREERYFQKQ